MLLQRSSSVSIAALLAAAVLLHPIAAAAHPPPFPGQDSEDRAAELLKRGNALSRAGKLAEALEAYTSAWALHETYPLAANLGNLELNLERYRDAAEHLAFAVRFFPSDGKPAVRAALLQGLDQAKRHVGALRLHTSVEAQVSLDGKYIDFAADAEELFVEPGSHAVVASQSGYASDRRQVQIATGEAQTIELTLVAGPSPNAPAGAAPPAPAPGPQGAPHERSKIPAVVGAALAGVGVALGTGFTIAANHQSSAAATLRAQIVGMPGHPPCPGTAQPLMGECAELRSNLSRHDRFANAAVWSFVAAGAFAAGTGAYLVWATRTSSPARTARIRVIPSAGSQGGALFITGTF
jgi:tetratricopeptide (TPR) repeat protein